MQKYLKNNPRHSFSQEYLRAYLQGHLEVRRPRSSDHQAFCWIVVWLEGGVFRLAAFLPYGSVACLGFSWTLPCRSTAGAHPGGERRGRYTHMLTTAAHNECPGGCSTACENICWCSRILAIAFLDAFLKLHVNAWHVWIPGQISARAGDWIPSHLEKNRQVMVNFLVAVDIANGPFCGAGGRQMIHCVNDSIWHNCTGGIDERIGIVIGIGQLPNSAWTYGLKTKPGWSVLYPRYYQLLVRCKMNTGEIFSYFGSKVPSPWR